MRPAVRRWLAVGAAAAVLASLPWAVSRIPAGSSDISAQELAQRIALSDDVPYTGYAEAAGGLILPITSNFADLADLFGDRTKMRVWYGGPGSNRVDAIDYTGERDVYTDDLGVWTWDYEAGEATRSPQTAAEVRIPSPGDLLPPALARRLLSGAEPAELSRLPHARVAGHGVPGVRLRPANPSATIDHIDVWADADTGLALRVAVYGDASAPAMDSAFLDIDLSAPDSSLLEFVPPPGSQVRTDNGDEIGRLQQRGGVDSVQLPPALAGFPRTGDGGFDAVGVYGIGVTTFAAVYLPQRVSRSLHSTLADAPGTVVEEVGLSTTSGPVSVLLADTGRGSQWLLSGTVAVQTLLDAAAVLIWLGSGR